MRSLLNSSFHWLLIHRRQCLQRGLDSFQLSIGKQCFWPNNCADMQAFVTLKAANYDLNSRLYFFYIWHLPFTFPAFSLPMHLIVFYYLFLSWNTIYSSVYWHLQSLNSIEPFTVMLINIKASKHTFNWESRAGEL